MSANTNSKVYVGNLSWNTSDEMLRQAFGDYGEVLDSIVMRDRDTGRSRGFGFVTFGTQEQAQSAINGLNEQDLDGRRIKVNLANARGGGGGGGGRYDNDKNYNNNYNNKGYDNNNQYPGGGGYQGGYPGGGYQGGYPGGNGGGGY